MDESVHTSLFVVVQIHLHHSNLLQVTVHQQRGFLVGQIWYDFHVCSVTLDPSCILHCYV